MRQCVKRSETGALSEVGARCAGRFAWKRTTIGTTSH